MKNFRDIEKLSSYLDGQLNPSESARMESRISSDPELASAFNDLRATRSILRKLPARKAPRNFTLTRQMVGLKPPLPRSYSFFRFSTAFATVLLALTFAANALTQLPRISFGASAPMAAPQGAYGLGGGPAATEAPAAAATEAPMAAAPSLEMAIAPTATPPAISADSARVSETPTAEVPTAKEAGNASESQEQPQVNAKPAGREALVPIAWQIGLLVLGLVSGVVMLALRRSAKQKWK
jgi:anti-sigma factor RsiW